MYEATLSASQPRPNIQPAVTRTDMAIHTAISADVSFASKYLSYINRAPAHVMIAALMVIEFLSLLTVSPMLELPHTS